MSMVYIPEISFFTLNMYFFYFNKMKIFLLWTTIVPHGFRMMLSKNISKTGNFLVWLTLLRIQKILVLVQLMYRRIFFVEEGEEGIKLMSYVHIVRKYREMFTIVIVTTSETTNWRRILSHLKTWKYYSWYCKWEKNK